MVKFCTRFAPHWAIGIHGDQLGQPLWCIITVPIEIDIFLGPTPPDSKSQPSVLSFRTCERCSKHGKHGQPRILAEIWHPKPPQKKAFEEKPPATGGCMRCYELFYTNNCNGFYSNLWRLVPELYPLTTLNCTPDRITSWRCWGRHRTSVVNRHNPILGLMYSSSWHNYIIVHD